MSEIVIKVENLSKQYRLGQVGTGTLSHDINRWWHRARGKEDPYLKVGEINNRNSYGNSKYVWALRDINFEVQQGEVLGIIGKNGAGKSTLLKILSKVTGPTLGTIKARGRIASLLEVGTGFHPELTGRENIFLNGTILGMTRAEVSKKLEEIVDFAGIARFLDTPVKRYSSGMTVRLGFAVAAHLEPEILIVDEVLAVGDSAFQKKAIGKIQEVSEGQGRTVLFVSHNMGSIESICNKCILMVDGKLDMLDTTNLAINKYLSSGIAEQNSMVNKEKAKEDKLPWLRQIVVNRDGSDKDQVLLAGQNAYFKFRFDGDTSKISHDRYRFDFRIDTQFGEKVLWLSTWLMDSKWSGNEITFFIPELAIANGNYSLTTCLYYLNQTCDLVHNAKTFEIESSNFYYSGKMPPERQSKILARFELISNERS